MFSVSPVSPRLPRADPLALAGAGHPAARRGHVPAGAFEALRTAVFN